MRGLALFILLAVGLGWVKPAAADKKQPEGSSVRTVLPDLSKLAIVEVKLVVHDPAFINPESLTVRQDPKSGAAEMIYTGREVHGQGDHHWWDSSPGKKPLTAKGYQKIVTLLKQDQRWFIPPRTDPEGRVYSGTFELAIWVQPLKAMSVAEEDMITVSSSWFPNEQPTDEFMEIVRLVSQMYGVDVITRKMYD